MVNNNLCIIPARGGSKRIPRKNIRDFAGKPVIAYAVQAAQQSGLFSQIMVSTEDLEIAEKAIEFGAEVPFLRSNRRADDHATTSEVILEVLEAYRQQNKFFDYVCCLYPVSPLVKTERLLEGYHKMIGENRHAVFPVIPFESSIWRALSINDDGKVSMIWPENRDIRSQDLPQAYHDAGQWYWFSTEEFLNNPTVWSHNSAVIVLDPMEAQDIDNLYDWKMAEIKYAILQNS